MQTENRLMAVSLVFMIFVFYVLNLLPVECAAFWLCFVAVWFFINSLINGDN